MNLAMMKAALDLFLLAAEEKTMPPQQNVLFHEESMKLCHEIDERLVKVKAIVNEDFIDKVIGQC